MNLLPLILGMGPWSGCDLDDLIEEAGPVPTHRVRTAASRGISPVGYHPRGKPCPCGSGRKYKHCCVPPDRPQPSRRSEPCPG